MRIILVIISSLMLFSCANTYVQPNKDDSEVASLTVRPFRVDENDTHPPEVLMYIDKRRVVDVIPDKKTLLGTVKAKSAYGEIFVEAGKHNIDLYIEVYDRTRVKYNTFSIEVDFIRGNSYEIDIEVPKGLSLAEDINANSSAVIRVINATQGLELAKNKILLKDAGLLNNDNSVLDSIIQSTIQGIILTQ